MKIMREKKNPTGSNIWQAASNKLCTNKSLLVRSSPRNKLLEESLDGHDPLSTLFNIRMSYL